MNCKQINSPFLKGLLFGGIVLMSVLYVSFISRNPESNRNISYDEAVQRIRSNEVREINLESDDLSLRDAKNIKYIPSVSETQKIELLNQGNALNISVTLNDNPPPFVYLLQILFWLFLISPPIIVVLLFVIIRKMDAKK
jgi:ATP-dependent Zn protease